MYEYIPIINDFISYFRVNQPLIRLLLYSYTVETFLCFHQASLIKLSYAPDL